MNFRDAVFNFNVYIDIFQLFLIRNDFYIVVLDPINNVYSIGLAFKGTRSMSRSMLKLHQSMSKTNLSTFHLTKCTCAAFISKSINSKIDMNPETVIYFANRKNCKNFCNWFYGIRKYSELSSCNVS